MPALPRVGTFRLAGEEGRHAATVRRLRAGEQLDLVDGVGGIASCRVSAAGRNLLDLDVLGIEHIPAPQPRLTVVQALPKGDRGELAVALLTEVGVDRVVPWAARRCVTRWDAERGAKALERWRAAARAAAKQSRRSWWPQVTNPATTGEVSRLLRTADLGAVLHESGGTRIAELAVPPAGELVLVVGPEGGIGDDELAELAGPTLRLSTEVLRTSTAGIVAAAALFSRTPRWNGSLSRVGKGA